VESHQLSGDLLLVRNDQEAVFKAQNRAGPQFPKLRLNSPSIGK
jgi:hypothetical protein